MPLTQGILTRFDQSMRLATAGLRMMPTFLIIGGLKCGTTSLYNYLCAHPQVSRARQKEVFFFDKYYHRGFYWYQSNFPLRLAWRLAITGEASPHYIQHPAIPSRVRQAFPGIKIIALLRDPVDRLFSHYKHNVRNGWEKLDFWPAIEAEESRVGDILRATARNPAAFKFESVMFSYFRKGLYAEQLKQWYAEFPSDQVLVLQSEALFSDPVGSVEQVLNFLDLPQFQLKKYKVFNQATNNLHLPDSHQQLANLYRPFNEELFDLINRRFNWKI